MTARSFQRRIVAKVGEWFIAAAEWQPPQDARNRLLVIAVVLFLAITVVAIRRLPPLEFRWEWAVAASAFAAVTLSVNAIEYWLAARWLDVSIRGREAVHVSMLASAANLAPIPGAVLVRARDLYSRGAKRDSIVKALATIGGGWVAVSLLAAVISLFAAGRHKAAFAALLLSMVATAMLPVIGPRVGRRFRTTAQCLGVEAVSVGAQAAGFLAVFRALGLDADLSEVLGLPLAGALASASGFFPGGLGLRELIAAGLAEMVGLSAASGALGSAVDRIVALVTLAIGGLLLLLTAWVGAAIMKKSSDGGSKRNSKF